MRPHPQPETPEALQQAAALAKALPDTTRRALMVRMDGFITSMCSLCPSLRTRNGTSSGFARPEARCPVIPNTTTSYIPTTKDPPRLRGNAGGQGQVHVRGPLFAAGRGEGRAHQHDVPGDGACVGVKYSTWRSNLALIAIAATVIFWQQFGVAEGRPMLLWDDVSGFQPGACARPVNECLLFRLKPRSYVYLIC